MAGGEAIRAEIARGLQEVFELHFLIALHAGNGRLAAQVAVGKVVHHRLAEAAFVIEHVMGNADAVCHAAGIVNVRARAARAGAAHGLAVIVQLKRDADHIIALFFQEGRDDRGINAARHRHHDAGFSFRLIKSERIGHGREVTPLPADHKASPGNFRRGVPSLPGAAGTSRRRNARKFPSRH